MHSLSLAEIRDNAEQMLTVFERDEHRFYVVIDLTHQLLDELAELTSSDED